MKPYYQDDHATIYHGDCLKLKHLWDIADGVLLTDPPYGMNYVSNSSKYGKTDPIEGDLSTTLRDGALAAWGDRPSLVFGTWRLPKPATTRHVLIWDKGESPGMGDLSIPWGLSFEEVYVAGAGWIVPTTSKRLPNVLRYNTVPAAAMERAHPTPKPLALIHHLIERCPPLADVVDPFMGSGTTLRAAKNLGRRSIGIEIDERYCEIAAKRLSQEVLDFG